ncbi:MAG TPA: HAMP domain-containing histidine kinase [Ghiorsea sp.]|nr:HAMP domain-containing histidine kinase [Ghiorsea sp.]
MNMDMLWLLTLVAALVLYYRLQKVKQRLEMEQQDHARLQHKYESLQRTLKTRGQRLDVLLSSISEVVLRVDHLGRVMGGNTQASELFHLSDSPNLPQSMLVFYRDNDWLKAYQQALKALPEHQVLPEMKVDGRVFLPRLAELNKQEALLLCMDVTAYTQLQKKQKSLLENLMHDLKTPLTSLLGYARSIEAFSDDVELRQEAVSVIAREAKHINALMNSMLTLNQIEHQQTKVDESCDVVAVAKQVWQSLEYAMQQKQVLLKDFDSSQSMRVAMSEVDCHRILMNVADNAVRFSPVEGSIHFSIEDTDSVVCIRLQDEGCGISGKHINRVTERFYRVDDVRGRKKEEGHGLGLAIVKEILERDGGSLKLDSSEKVGLSVSIELMKSS